jgi:hypothetical protein
MSQAVVEQIMGKMLLNTGFRQLVAANRTQALADFDLSEGERTAFENMDLEDFSESVTGLDARVSKGIHLN